MSWAPIYRICRVDDEYNGRKGGQVETGIQYGNKYLKGPWSNMATLALMSVYSRSSIMDATISPAAVTTIPSRKTGEPRPDLPRRSSSLHKLVITKLRPLPFQYLWSVWHSKPNDQGEYLLTMLCDHVADIGTFYRIFNNMPWTEVKQNDSIHIFRSGVKPLWEDRENRQGGRWLIRVRPDNHRAIRVWEEICLLCCGGELQAAITQEHDHILGMSFSPMFPSGPSKAIICGAYCY